MDIKEAIEFFNELQTEGIFIKVKEDDYRLTREFRNHIIKSVNDIESLTKRSKDFADQITNVAIKDARQLVDFVLVKAIKEWYLENNLKPIDDIKLGRILELLKVEYNPDEILKGFLEAS